MNRVLFAKEWFEKGEEALDKENVFEAYIYLWLSLTISTREYFENRDRIKDPNHYRSGLVSDIDQIEFWAKNNYEQIMTLMNSKQEDMLELSERKGTNYDHPILDIKNSSDPASVIQNMTDFSNYWLNENRHSTRKNLAINLVYILNRVRNNLFHGEKFYNDENDRKLLELVCPILKDLSNLCIVNQLK